MGGFFPDTFGKKERIAWSIGMLWIVWLHVNNLGIDLMDVDAAQYASITLEMSLNYSHLQVFHHGSDYLDKPPLLFWLSVLPYRFFGASDIWFRLPSLLVAWLGLASLYQLVKSRHSPVLAFYTATVAISTQAFFQFVHDVRTDTLLTGFSLFSLLQFSNYLKSGKILHLFSGATGIGLAMLAKGPIGLIIPASGLACELIFTRQLKQLLQPRLLWVPLLVALILAPMAYGLYLQFDLHPEKYVYGLKGPSGLRFFFWTQSFGRITGENYWDNNAPWHYLFGTSLWDGLPWVLVMWYGMFKYLLKRNHQKDFLLLGSFILPFLALSSSKFQLPHYIFPLLPIGAFFTANELNKLNQIPSKVTRWFLVLPSLLLHLAGFVILLFVFEQPWPITLLYALLVAGCILIVKALNQNRIFLATLFSILFFYTVMSFTFYPELMKFQAGSMAGKYISDHHLQGKIWFYKDGSHALDVYTNKISTELSEPEDLEQMKPGDLLYCEPDDTLRLYLVNNQYKVLAGFKNYPVTHLSYTFLNPESRQSVIKSKFLIKKL